MTGALSKTSRAGLAKYSPDKGLKTIAIAEAAEKHYARAKDATKLQQAIRAKLQAQAEFVFWWDTQAAKDKGGGDVRNTRRRPATGVQTAGKNGIPERSVIDRWRRKLNDPDKFEATYEQAAARYLKILELEASAHVSHNTGEYEWYTPAEYIEAARDVLGAIDLDPATTRAANTVVKAAQIFTAEDSGLDQPWHGRVWLNPPYSQPLVQQFADKLAGSVQAGDVTAAVVLINNATETEFFQTLASVAMALCFPKGRVRFWSPGKDSATPLQGQAILYAGSEPDTFCARFAAFGLVAQFVRAA